MITQNVIWFNFLMPGMGKPKLGELEGFVPRPVTPSLHGGWWARRGLNTQILGRWGQQRTRGSWCGDARSGWDPSRHGEGGKELGATEKLPLWFPPQQIEAQSLSA